MCVSCKRVEAHRLVTARRQQLALALIVIALATAVAYAPSFRVPFQYDDEARLLHNVAMQHGELANALRWLGDARVVPSLTLMLNYRLGGYEPLGYHIGNFAVHLLATFGVFALALSLCQTPRLRDAWPGEGALRLATAAALVFGCHPLQTQAVTYVIQRYASMAALFYVWAVVCYVRGRLRWRHLQAGSPRPYFIAGGVLAVMAVLSKENSVSLPAACLLAEWVGFGRPRRWRAMMVGGVIGALVILAVPIVWKTEAWTPAHKNASASDVPLLTRMVDSLFSQRFSPLRGGRAGPFEYLLTQFTVLPRYLGLMVRPWGLNIDHDVPIARTLSLPVMAGFIFLVLLLAFGLTQMRPRPLVAFGILWFFVTISVESSIFPIDDVMVEHRMYLPMAGLAVLVGWAFATAVARAPRVAMPAGIALVAALMALTFARNVVWQTTLTLWLDAAEKSPDKARPHTNLGAVYQKADQLDDAAVQYCRALKLDPDDPVAHDNLDDVMTALGKFDHVAPKVVERRANGQVVLELPDAVVFCP